MATERDALAELDSVESYVRDLIGTNPPPGLDADLQRVAGAFGAVRELVQNVVELSGEYSRGVTHEERVGASMGSAPDPRAAEIAELRAQLAKAQAVSTDG